MPLCSVNQIEKNIVLEVKKKVVLEREAISDELLSDINYILFLLKQKDFKVAQNHEIVSNSSEITSPEIALLPCRLINDTSA